MAARSGAIPTLDFCLLVIREHMKDFGTLLDLIYQLILYYFVLGTAHNTRFGYLLIPFVKNKRGEENER